TFKVQAVKRLVLEEGVVGSNPATPTTFPEPPIAYAASYAERNSPVINNLAQPRALACLPAFWRRGTRADEPAAAAAADWACASREIGQQGHPSARHRRYASPHSAPSGGGV